eukprot:CAMPEP_0185574530 /NCGR_PEP_ID=MMETSP0434-20130131/5978_1 /TAXON_ID=626734 ORGANISM="Favella taraikaensis, Strain Fe Narragansett Bay" /NCGR_SAMPLE_ID=MMETSP0434 /ASSEMBLY_ACC=CAM_ASM_000379 /LENGTH=179 /DNA_ID=CAMNT_0028191147 /DNA_START=2175 /DNA_END=2714 /DNA_ORIENTATION=-
MVATDTDVGDSDFGHLRPAHFDALPRIKIDHMDSLRSRLRHRLNNHVVLNTLMDLVIEKAKLAAVWSHKDVLERALANLALQVLPDVRVDICSLLAMAFAFEPFFKAAQTDVAQRSRALAGCDQLMVWQLLLGKTNPTNEVLRGAHLLGSVSFLVFHAFFVLGLQRKVVLLHIEGKVST